MLGLSIRWGWVWCWRLCWIWEMSPKRLVDLYQIFRETCFIHNLQWGWKYFDQSVFLFFLQIYTCFHFKNTALFLHRVFIYVSPEHVFLSWNIPTNTRFQLGNPTVFVDAIKETSSITVFVGKENCKFRDKYCFNKGKLTL